MTSRDTIWKAPYRALTIGIILVVTAVAFEGLAVTTIAPALARDLQGESGYAWIFSGYLLAQLLGTILTGQLVDRTGPANPFLVTMVIFALGIVLAAVAGSMPLLIAGRILQGFGAGAIVNCVYTAITLRFPDVLRTQILAVFSSAYILPSLIGPYVAGIIAEQFSWRYVFWLVLPFILISSFLTTPSFRGLQPVANKRQPLRFWSPLLLAAGTGGLLTGLGRLPDLWGVFLTVAGVLVLIRPIRMVLPEGTFRASPGLPAILTARGLFFAAYLGTQTYLVLALTEELGFSAGMAGLVVASASISWSAAANVQARLDRRDAGLGRNRRVLTGLWLMLAGILMVLPLVALGSSGYSLALAIGSQMIVGFGIGLAHPTSGALAFSHAPPGEAGKVSADLTVADTFTPAVAIGAAGAMLLLVQSAGLSRAVALTAVLASQALLILLGLAAAWRNRNADRVRHSS